MQPEKVIKGSLSTVVLQLLHNNGKMYGYEITKAVADASKGKTKITEAALYPTLHKLQSDGFLKVTTKNVLGRERKYYALTKIGSKELAIQLENLKEAIAALQKILKYEIPSS